MITTTATAKNPVLPCLICGEEVDLRDHLTPTQIEEGFQKLKTQYVQNAFPTLSSGVREMFISGICELCYDSLFKE